MTTSCSIPGLNVPRSRFPDPEQDLPAAEGEQRVVLAGGCFWCVEAVFLAIDGVTSVESGYAGGHASSANYEAVCSGTTGHAEVVDVHYDPARVSFGELLKVFFSVAHDPTQLNRQGNDRGTQYRSAVFYETAEQRRASRAAAGSRGLHPPAQSGRSVPGSDSDHAGAAGGILPGRRVPPELCCPESLPAIHHGRGRPENGKACRQLS